ncbi:hypothetical protein GOBAR_AA07972 [Gossypium barbadense]|uniref:Piwi domain-containing protein n=1 Tax=Gossypium barbadense TaxID=3634 RepID=A0A2P5YAR5_GOSBA|nr:hypothetical protein GOBAR_AA07972 [Gossypium barbadense]
MAETGKNWHKKLPPTLYAYAGVNTFNSSCFKVSDKVDDGIMKEALLDFYTSSGKRKPDQIIIFRDGACKFLDEKWNLKDCGYCCTKNHHTKFFQQGSPNNVLHGTVIDNKVCHPKNNDFYLGTHAGMIGITRQTYYHLHSWGQFMKIRDASETSLSHGGMYAPRVISVPKLSRLKDKGLTNNSQDCCWGNPFLMGL